MTEGVSIIVSPLKALIHDQTQRLMSLDIPAIALTGEMDGGQAQVRMYVCVSCEEIIKFPLCSHTGCKLGYGLQLSYSDES